MSAMGKQCVREITFGFGASAGESRGGTLPLSALMSCGRSQSESACVVEREGTSMSELGKLGLRMRSCVPGVGAAANLGKGKGRRWEVGGEG
jgi:hypothetical protein